jgi:hypothetical protein
MMYVSNTIGISTHEADLKHNGVEFEGTSKNCQWSRREVERERIKKENKEEEREREGVMYSRN